MLNLLVMFLLAQAEFTPRVDVLSQHVVRLEAITVAATLEAEKAQRLDSLKAAVAAGVTSTEQFDALYTTIDDVRTWLLANSPGRPTRAEGTFIEEPDAWVVRNPALELRLAKEKFSITVKTLQETWEFLPCDDRDVEAAGKVFGLASAGNRSATEFFTGYSAGMLLTLADFPDAPGFSLALTISLIGNEIVVDVAAPGDIDKLHFVNWPKPIKTGNTAADFAVVPHMQGALIPGNYDREINQQDLSNSRSLYMPWWGQIRGTHGVLTILETDDDAGAKYHHPAGGPTVIQPRWYSSLGRLRYLRTIRYVFQENATHVTFAKRYRQYAQESGRFVALAQKRVRTPGIDDVIGRPVIHLGALYHNVKGAHYFNKDQIESNHALQPFDELAAQLRTLKEKGIDSAYVHLDGWGYYGYDNGHPDVVPAGQEQGGWDGLRRFSDTCADLGYLFAVHDQYRDFYKNAASFDDRLAAIRMDGSREEHCTWCGGPQTILSARFAPEYLRRNHDAFAANGIKVRGAYLDVFSVVPLEESYQPSQPMSRSDCARYRRECFDILHARGYVMSSEEPTEYLCSTIELVHHGPYPTAPNLGGGERVGIPVPLFNLVYHDALLTPWDMGEDGGWGIPNGDAGRLHCVLNAGLPYIGPGADAQMVARVKEAAALNKRCALFEMVNHEFLEQSFRKQRSTFSDGTTVTVDFDAKTYTITPGL